ncbi:Cytochrome P450 2L1, partial [Armadillidium nasatum]
FIFILTLLWFHQRKPSNYPPGPWGFPLIGWPPRNVENFNREILKCKENKQDIIGWRIGTRFIVIILDYDLYIEAFRHPNINIRPDMSSIVFQKGEGGKHMGLSLARGSRSKQNRRITLKHFRDFGMGKEKLLLDAHYEADELVNSLKKVDRQLISISANLQTALLNNVWQMVGSVRYDHNDEGLIKYNELAAKWHAHGFRMMIMDLFPWLENILPTFMANFLFKIHVQKELADELKSYIKKHIDNHERDMNEGNIRDYIDTYLLEMKKQKDDPYSTMSGSTLTTLTSIETAIFHLMKSPKIQEKLQKEIDEFLPKGTQYLMKDRSKLPYTEAFIHETLRHASVVGVNPRAASEDTKIGSYVIPKDAWVFGHTFLVHFDEKLWDAPSEFRPERFLDSNGKFVAPTKGFVPFGHACSWFQKI